MTALEANGFLLHFGPEGRRRLVAAAARESCPAGALIFPEGAPSDWVYLLLDGEVELFKGSLVLAVVRPGDYFGELGILGQPGRSTGARTRTAASLAKVPRAAALEALAGEPPAATIQLMGRILDYLRETNERYTAAALSKEKMQLVGEMANSILHDFKNPLTMIQLAVHIIDREHQDPSTVKSCGVILEQTQRMLGMARDLHEFSRGRPVMEVRPTRLAALFERFRGLNEQYLEAAKVRLDVSCGDLSAPLDPDRFLRVLQNLVGNAVDALSPRGGVIELSARAAGGRVEILVRDDGPGVPPRVLERMFQPFTTHGKAQGLGLGLAICKQLVEAHGGTIAVDSAPGQGTTFRILLPTGQ